MRQNYEQMANAYQADHSDVDWSKHEVFFVFYAKDRPGWVVVGGHRPIDAEKNAQIDKIMNTCCCGEKELS